MKKLRQIRTNISYLKDGDDFVKVNELIFLLEETLYQTTNDNEVVRKKEIEKVSFMLLNSEIDDVIQYLERLKKVDNEDLS